MAGNETATQDDHGLGDLYKFFTFIAVAFALALYLQILKNRHYWVIMETCFGVMSLMMLPFASKMVPVYFIDGSDSLAIYLFYVMIFAKTAQTAIIFLTRKCQDPTVGISVSITNILTRGTLLFCALHGLVYTTNVSHDALRMDLISITLFLIGDLCHLSKLSTREGNLTVGDPISLHLSIDAFITFLYGALLLGFPKMFLGIVNSAMTLKEGHVGLTKVYGCFISGGAVLSLASLCFKNENDAVMTLKSKLAFYVPAFVLGGINYFTNQQYQGPGHTVLMVGVVKVLMLNAGYAVWKHEKNKVE